MTEKNKTAGYRVHFARLRNINDKLSAIRTHKFKCKIESKELEVELKDKFDKVSAVVDSSKEGSILWFLVQMYCLGFLFVPKDKAKGILLQKFGNLPIEIANTLNQLDPNFREKIQDEMAFYELLTTRSRDVYSKLNNGLYVPIINSLANVFYPKSEIKIKADNFRNFPLIADYHNKFVEIIEETKDLTPENIQEVFGCIPEIVNTEGTTFVVQNIGGIEKIRKNSNGDKTIYDALFDYILPASQTTKKSPQLLTGAGENQNGLSNFLNLTLTKFQESEENCLRLISYSSPSLSQEEREELAKSVYNLAKKVNSSETDFIKNNWADYRSLIGGRLEGWISNFMNRLDLFKESLANENTIFINKNGEEEEKTGKHTEIFAKIREFCDVEKIFLQDQQDNLKGLEDLQPQIIEALENRQTEDNLGNLIFQYNIYLKSFREFLIKWHEQGVRENDFIIWDGKGEMPNNSFHKNCFAQPKKGEEKEIDENIEILGFWKDSLIPKELEQYPRFLGEAQKNPKKVIEDSRKTLLDYAEVGNKFVEIIREKNEIDENFANHFWLKTEKFNKEKNEWETKGSGDRKEMNEKFGFFHKNLEALRKIGTRYNKDIQEEIYSFLNEFIDNEEQKEFWKKYEKDKNGKKKLKFANFKFFVSGYEYRDKQYLKTKTDLSFEEYLEKFKNHFLEDLGKWEKFFELEKDGITRELSTFHGEFLKTYWGLCLRDLSKNVKIPYLKDVKMKFANNVLNKLIFNENEETKKKYLKNEVDLQTLQRFVQAGIGSKVRAKISNLSRESFIERNVLQVTNGSQSMLQYVPREWGHFFFPESNDENLTKAQRRRRKISRKKLEKRKNQDCGFSENAKKSLNEFGIDFEQENKEIVAEIWGKLKKENAENSRELTQVLGEIPHSWTMVLKTKIPLSHQETGECFSEIENNLFFYDIENGKFNSEKTRNYFHYSFPIETSVYQKQFLERFLWGDKDEILEESLMGSSVIIEQEKLVKWSGADMSLENGTFSLYWALPFQFTKEKNLSLDEENFAKFSNTVKDQIFDKKNGKLTYKSTKLGDWKKSEKNSLRTTLKKLKSENLIDAFDIWMLERNFNRNIQKILGIDLGEYGFGYAIFNPETNEFEKSDFIKIPQLQQMRDDVANWKDSQTRGIFSRPTTHLADIREKAAGAVRNQIHALALKHNAVPIYEDSVDGFESGGQRISKLYKTLKTSDVIGGNSNDADKGVRKHFWGLDFAQIGGVIGASKTSQTCRKCGRCASSELQAEISVKKFQESLKKLKDKENLTEKEGKKVKELETNIEKGKEIFAKIFTKTNLSEESVKDLEEKLKSVYKKQRQATEKEQENIKKGKRKRGTIEHFYCQIEGCNNDCDCDEQAARNIALKYYLKQIATAKEIKEFSNNKGQFSSLKYFLEKSPDWEDTEPK